MKYLVEQTLEWKIMNLNMETNVDGHNWLIKPYQNVNKHNGMEFGLKFLMNWKPPNWGGIDLGCEISNKDWLIETLGNDEDETFLGLGLVLQRQTLALDMPMDYE